MDVQGGGISATLAKTAASTFLPLVSPFLLRLPCRPHAGCCSWIPPASSRLPPPGPCPCCFPSAARALSCVICPVYFPGSILCSPFPRPAFTALTGSVLTLDLEPTFYPSRWEWSSFPGGYDKTADIGVFVKRLRMKLSS